MSTREYGRMWMVMGLGIVVAMDVEAAEKSKHAVPTGPVQYVIRPEGRLWLEGSSTMHKYHGTATQLTLVLSAILPADKTGGGHIWGSMIEGGVVRGMALIIPVVGITCEDHGLEENMQKTLKKDVAPLITFTMTAMNIEPARSDRTAIAKISGMMSIAGKSRAVDLEAQIKPAKDGLEVRGQKELFMKDYGIDPPGMMLGLISTDNRIVVHYDMIIGFDHAGKTSDEDDQRREKP